MILSCFVDAKERGFERGDLSPLTTKCPFTLRITHYEVLLKILKILISIITMI